MAHPVSRFALIVVALVAAAWLALALRSIHLVNDGISQVNRAGAKAGPAQMQRARRPFSAARRAVGDADVLIREAATLVFLGRRADAAGPAAAAARLEPDNVEAWVVLFASTRGRDPSEARRAARRAIALDPSTRRSFPSENP